MEQEIENIELSLSEAKKVVEIGKKALKLADNKIFKELILEGYFKDEAARLTGLIGDPQITEQEGVIQDLAAIASFQRYLRRLVQVGNMMEKTIQDYEETLDELRQEV